MAATPEEAHKAYDRALVRFESKYTGAMDRLRKDLDELLAFYDFPAEHWVHIRTTNPIESTFSTVRLRTKRARNCGSRETTLAMVYKLRRRVISFAPGSHLWHDGPITQTLINKGHTAFVAVLGEWC